LRRQRSLRDVVIDIADERKKRRHMEKFSGRSSAPAATRGSSDKRFAQGFRYSRPVNSRASSQL